MLYREEQLKEINCVINRGTSVHQLVHYLYLEVLLHRLKRPDTYTVKNTLVLTREKMCNHDTEQAGERRAVIES